MMLRACSVRHAFFGLCSAWLIAISLSPCQAHDSASKPNIIFILADDLGIGDVACYGKERCQIETPNIDSLARGGLQFVDAYSNASVCVPTRVAIMTGRYPLRFGPPERGGAWGFLGPRFGMDTFTLGDLCQQAGYQTGYIGKWHLGTRMVTLDGEVQGETNVDYRRPIEIGPREFGFDYSFVLPGSLDMYPYAFIENNHWVGEVTEQKGWSAFNRVGPAEKDFEDHEVLETFYRQAETFIASQENTAPFFLYLALTAPHTPTSPGIAFRGKSELGVYGDFVMEVDHAIERILDALKAKGIYEDTLVLFSSDHGPASYAGNILKATPGQIRELEDQGHFAAGPHRGYKFSVYQGGLHVPLIAHWPAEISAGGQCDALIGLNDLMATIAELTQQELTDTQGPDSISFANLLSVPDSAPTRQNLILQSTSPFVIRDGKWKLCLCPGSSASGQYGNLPKSEDAWRSALDSFAGNLTLESLGQAPFVQLFDVEADEHEDTNLASEHPGRVEAMISLLKSQIAAGRSTPGSPLRNDNQRVNIHPRLPAFVRERLQ